MNKIICGKCSKELGTTSKEVDSDYLCDECEEEEELEGDEDYEHE